MGWGGGGGGGGSFEAKGAGLEISSLGGSPSGIVNRRPMVEYGQTLISNPKSRVLLSFIPIKF